MDSNKTAGEEAKRQIKKNAASNLEQVLAATPHKTPTVPPPASYRENCKNRTTSTNIHSATMWGYRMLSRGPAWSDERSGKMVREGQGYPCYQHNMMMMIYIYIYICIYIYRERETKRQREKNKVIQREEFNIKEYQRYNISVQMNHH